MTVKAYFNWTLALFVASFVVLPTSKMVNNFYYVFIAIPGLYFLLRNYQLLRPISFTESAFLALCLYITTYAFFVYPKVMVHTLYVLVFVYAVSRFVDASLFESKLFARLLFWGSLLYAAVCVFAFYIIGDADFGSRLNPGLSRLYSPIQISMLIACSLFVIGPHWLNCKNYLEGFTGVLLVIFAIALVFQSRTGLVAVGLWIIFMLIHALKGYGFRGGITLAASLLLLVLVSIPVFELAGQTSQLIERADAYRFSIWSGYLMAAHDCGLFLGCGFPEVVSPHLVLEPRGEGVYVSHNIVINLLYHFGVVPVLLFAAIMLSSLYMAWRQGNWWGGYLFAGAVTLILDGNRIFNSPDIVWLAMWLPLALILARSWLDRVKFEES